MTRMLASGDSLEANSSSRGRLVLRRPRLAKNGQRCIESRVGHPRSFEEQTWILCNQNLRQWKAFMVWNALGQYRFERQQ